MTLDHFKAVNDRFGHVAGDAVLRETAEAARAVLPPGAEIYRLGGEEFAILVPRCDPRGAVDLAERLRTAIVNCRTIVGETEVRVSASFGTATLNPDIPDEQVWVQRADAALYASKNKGRDQVTCASQSNVLDLLSPDRCRAFCRS
jgi:diguanylate cyclase (GGDEF)-like protein